VYMRVHRCTARHQCPCAPGAGEGSRLVACSSISVTERRRDVPGLFSQVVRQQGSQVDRCSTFFIQYSTRWVPAAPGLLSECFHLQLGDDLLLLAALVYCVSFGDRNPRIPFVPTHSTLRRCGIFPPFFWDRCRIFPCGKFPVQNPPVAPLKL
jgi:hypothetical protein